MLVSWKDVVNVDVEEDGLWSMFCMAEVVNSPLHSFGGQTTPSSMYLVTTALPAQQKSPALDHKIW